jgi:hypothetical protein
MHKNESVDPDTGLRAFVAHDLSPCSLKYASKTIS